MKNGFEVLLRKLLTERKKSGSDSYAVSVTKNDLKEEYKKILDKVAVKMIIDEFEDLNIVKALMKLYPNERIVIAFYIIKEFDPEEIATLLDTSLNNIYASKSRALKRLKEELKKVDNL